MTDIRATRYLMYNACSVPSMPMYDPLSLMNRLFCGWVVRDRFGFLNHYLPFRISGERDEIPKADDSLTLAEICDAKAQEIIAMNCPVTVAWSGGVDSTTVLCALLRNGLGKDGLAVVCAPSSKEEYPWFHKFLRDEGVRMTETYQVASAFDNTTDGVILTGWCADQLFGSNIHLRNLDLYNLPWVDGVKRSLADTFNIVLPDAVFGRFEAAWSAYAKHVGVEAEQFCEMAWLYNFGCKWAHVSQDSKMLCAKQATRERIINFFEDSRFQSWSMAHFPELRRVNAYRMVKHYKRPLKQYIYGYTNDAGYFNKKGKVNSWAYIPTDSNSRIIQVLDTDGYHAFRLKGNPDNPDMHKLNRMVARRYLKDEWLG